MESKVLQKRQQLLAAVLEWFQDKVREVMIQQIQIKDKYPKAYKNFKGYLEQLKVPQYNRWCRFLGCMVTPISYTEGNNHVVVLDNGLLSDHLAKIPVLGYANESRLLTLHVFNLNRRKHPIGDIHAHILGVNQLQAVNHDGADSIILDLKKLIDRKHEHMEDKACRLVKLGPGGELITVQGQELWNAVWGS